MDVVWARNPITAAEVIASLAPNKAWAPKTVKTFLTRLIDKKVLAVDKQDKAYVYRPAVKREDCVAAESESFLNRVFRGATASLVLHFSERARWTPEEIHELEQLLKEKKNRQ